jgi:hypothetical protein
VKGNDPGCSDERQYSRICLEGLKKITKIPIQDVAQLSITKQWYCQLNSDAVGAKEKHLETPAKLILFKK